jgi:hypothetical protein
MVRIVTGRTRDGAVARQAAVVEQPPSELDLFVRNRIVLRDRHIEIQSQRNRERCNEQ